MHILCLKENKTQSLCFDTKRRKCHQYLYIQIDFFACFFFCFPLYICQECKDTNVPGYLCCLPQLSGRYLQTKTVPVRFYFPLVRIAIITNISVTPFNVWWQKTKENKLCQEHKEELWALCIANRNMKYLSLCLRLVFHHKGKSGIAIWHNCSYVWYTLKSIENWSQPFYTNVHSRSIHQRQKMETMWVSTRSIWVNQW